MLGFVRRSVAGEGGLQLPPRKTGVEGGVPGVVRGLRSSVVVLLVEAERADDGSNASSKVRRDLDELRVGPRLLAHEAALYGSFMSEVPRVGRVLVDHQRMADRNQVKHTECIWA